MKNTLIQEGFVLFKWIKIDNIIVIISAVIVVRRSGVVISYTLKNIICSWRVNTQTSCRWKASLLINVGRINLLQNYYSTEIKTSCNLSAWFERFEEQLCCNEAVPHSLAPNPTLFCPHPPFHLFCLTQKGFCLWDKTSTYSRIF